MRSKPQILVIEDDPSISLGLRLNLEGVGYQVTVHGDGKEGLKAALEDGFDLLIVDVMLPRMNGYELVSALRNRGKETPVLILSAKSGDSDKVMGLDLGADDYVTKPFSVGELLARVRALLRRKSSSEPPTQGQWHFGQVVVDDEKRQVLRDGEAVELTVTEYDILRALITANGRILTRRQLLDMVWGDGHRGTERTVDNFLAQLRAKLEEDPTAPAHLLTVRGVGYRFEAG